MPITELSLAVVGADHANHNPRKQGKIDRRFEIRACAPGEPVMLELEPENPVDPNAVRVMSVRSVQIGYVRAERAQWIGSMIRQGIDVRAIFQGEEKWGASIRVTLDGLDPTLPAPKPPAQKAAPIPAEYADPDPDFYPDEEWPDV